MRSGFTVALRKLSTGHKLTSFWGESMDHLYAITNILMRSHEYERCYAVCTDWQGEVVFTIQPQGAAPPVPQRPQFAPPPARHYPEPSYAAPSYPVPQRHYPALPTASSHEPPYVRAIPVEDTYAACPGDGSGIWPRRFKP